MCGTGIGLWSSPLCCITAHLCIICMASPRIYIFPHMVYAQHIHNIYVDIWVINSWPSNRPMSSNVQALLVDFSLWNDLRGIFSSFQGHRQESQGRVQPWSRDIWDGMMDGGHLLIQKSPKWFFGIWMSQNLATLTMNPKKSMRLVGVCLFWAISISQMSQPDVLLVNKYMQRKPKLDVVANTLASVTGEPCLCHDTPKNMGFHHVSPAPMEYFRGHAMDPWHLHISLFHRQEEGEATCNSLKQAMSQLLESKKKRSWFWRRMANLW